MLRDEWWKVNHTIGVGHLLPLYGETPISIPDSYVAGIRENLMETQVLKALNQQFSLNEIVKIISGAFVGLEGEVEEPGKVRTKIRLTSSGYPITLANAEIVGIKREGDP
jgi:transcription antitermination factor NusG